MEQGYAQMYGHKPHTGLSTAALVLGILAVLACWAPLGSYAACVLAVLALVFGLVKLRQHAGRGRAMAGVILGVIGLTGAIYFSVAWTNYFIDLAEVFAQCQEDTGLQSGPPVERCLTDRAPATPFS